MCRGRWLCCRFTPTLEEKDNKAVLARFLHEVTLRRRDDFMAALGQAASQRFNNLVELALARLLRRIVPGFDTSFIEMLIAYPNMVTNDQSAISKPIGRRGGDYSANNQMHLKGCFPSSCRAESRWVLISGQALKPIMRSSCLPHCQRRAFLSLALGRSKD